VPEEKLTVIHRGVDPAMFPYNFVPDSSWLNEWQQQHPQLEGKYVITLPGRITRWKGQLDFIKVIATLKAKGLPAHGLLVGEPHPKKLEFLAEVKNAIEAAGLEKDITLVGHRSDLREVMAISDVVVSCSTDPEAFGRVTLEALAIGKPVTAYAHGGVAEQLDALLPDGKILLGNTKAMSDLLASWHQKPATPMRNNPFTLSKMICKTITLYRSFPPID